MIMKKTTSFISSAAVMLSVFAVNTALNTSSALSAEESGGYICGDMNNNCKL